MRNLCDIISRKEGQAIWMEIAICDDIPQQCEQVRTAVSKFYSGNTPVNFTICSNGNQLVEHCNNPDITFDVIFLDVLMPGINGLETAQMIRLADESVPIVFVTSADHYAAQGYDVDAVSYLLKPVNEQDIRKVLTKIEKRRSLKPDKTVDILSDGKRIRIPIETIKYVEKVGRKVLIHRFGDSPIMSNQPMREITAPLSKERGFTACFQSNYINLRLVDTIDQTRRKAKMKDEKEIEISRERMRDVLDEFLYVLGDD